MLTQAVEHNLDAIHGRLPAPLRPFRRVSRFLLKWSGRLAPLVLVALAGGGMGRSPGTAPGAAVHPDWAAEPAPRESHDPGTPPDAAILSQQVPPGALALPVHRVIIDAGHGGTNLGTSSTSGLHEKDLTLDIAHRMRRLVVAQGLEAVLTRGSDETVSLQQRAALANDRRGDIFVSIHLNWLASPSAQGIETYHLGPSDGPELDAVAERENQHSGYSLADLRPLLEEIYTDARRDQSRRLARSVQQALVHSMRRAEPTLADRGVKMAPFVVLVATQMPAILAEVSCLSNLQEATRLGSPAYRQTIAEALASGVAAFARGHG